MKLPKNAWHLVITLVLILGLAGAIVALNRVRRPTAVTIGVIEPLQHVAVSDITRGIKDGLANESFTVLVQNANSDKTAIPQILARYRDQKVSIFVPIFTGTAQITKTTISDHPIVFAAVTDPAAAGLITEPKQPGGNITGVSDLWPIGAELDLIREIMPSAKTIGIIYDPGDPSAAATMPILKAEALKRGFTLELRPVASINEVAQGLASLQGKVDLLFTANDVTVTAAFPALVKFSVEHKIPLFAGDYSSVQRGAIAAIGQNYYDVGLEAAKLIRDIATGRQPSSIPVVYTTGGDIYLNSAASEKMGVTIPTKVLGKAKQVYKSISEEDVR